MLDPDSTCKSSDGRADALPARDPTLSAHSKDELAGLLRKVAEGDREAFRRLYALTSGHLLRAARQLLRNRANAEDALQETYLRIWRYSRSYNPAIASPLAWMTQIMRNRAIDIRAARADFVVAIDDVEESAPDGINPITSITGDNISAEVRVSSSHIAECFTRLSGPYRQVLHLSFAHGLSHSEIAARMQIPLGTVKTWLRRALLELKTLVGEKGAQDPARQDKATETVADSENAPEGRASAPPHHGVDSRFPKTRTRNGRVARAN